MSRMTKFLKQTCQVEHAKRTGSTVNLTEYGDVIYEAPITIRCRREKVIRDVQTGTGAILRTSSRYFLDETAGINTDDRIDGMVVLEVEEYVNQLGYIEGYECYV